MNTIKEYYDEQKQIVIEMLEKLVKEEKELSKGTRFSEGYVMGMEHSIDIIKQFLKT